MLSLILGVLGVGAAILLLGFTIYIATPFPYPWPTESDRSHHRFPWWELYYIHKYLRPRKRAAKGSGLEEYFARQSFNLEGDDLADLREVSIRSAGDMMARRDLLGDRGKHLWDDVGEYFFGGDITTGNLEFAINENRVIEKLIRFSVPADFAEPILRAPRFGSIDYVSLGNNHLNDSLGDGIRRTCEHLDSLGIKRSGANRTADEQDRFPIFEVAGAKIAMLSYSFSTNEIPLDSDMPYGVNLVRFNALSEDDYDDSLIRRHVDLARERGANFIVSHNHWSIDLELYPPKRIVERAHRLFEYGIDLIVGHHPHVVGPVERYEAADGRTCIAYYSLGSLTTHGLIFPVQRLSLIAETVLEVGRDAWGKTIVRPGRLALTPVFFSMSDRRRRGFRLIPLNEALAAIEGGETHLQLTRRDLRDIKKLGRLFERHFVYEGIEYR